LLYFSIQSPTIADENPPSPTSFVELIFNDEECNIVDENLSSSTSFMNEIPDSQENITNEW